MLAVGGHQVYEVPGVWWTLDVWVLPKWHKEGWIQILPWLEGGWRGFWEVDGLELEPQGPQADEAEDSATA